ncbi:hypothetical protein C8R46DRAFT_1063410 [Mycena filopes]|nr:hypothetical protein C8R46DRAFT_1063410 [Mycena filopes]
MAPAPSADDVLKSFVAVRRVCSGHAHISDSSQRAPMSRYTFDSERGAAQSEICREPEGSNRARECITIQMQSKRLFEAMQNLGFFCALPMDPKRTHMECTPIPK